jgi:HSP20 family protein
MPLVRPKIRQDQPRVIQPRVNIHETDNDIVLEAEMVGLGKEDIGVELKGNELTIKGKTKECVIPQGYTILHKERCPLEYIRTFVLGEEVDKDKIDAKYENGILKVTLTKSSKAYPKKIDIKG